MTWNWQTSDWPRFSCDQGRLRKAEELFLVQGGVFVGVVKHLDDTDRLSLTIDAIGDEAVTTSEIEGEVLDRASVQSSIRAQFGLAPDVQRAGPKESGMAEMTVDLYRTYAEPLSHDKLFLWHSMVLKGRSDLTSVSRTAMAALGERYRRRRWPSASSGRHSRHWQRRS